MGKITTSLPAHTASVPKRENTKLGMWVFLGGEAIFFASLILLIAFRRSANIGYDELFRSHLSAPVIALNTFILLTSSYFVVRALLAIDQDNAGGMHDNLIRALMLGALFLSGQAYEWTSLFRQGVTYSTTFGLPFFTVTGIHGLHVFVGILWLLYLIGSRRVIPFTRKNSLGIENFGRYWHFVVIIWILLFTLIYLV